MYLPVTDNNLTAVPGTYDTSWELTGAQWIIHLTEEDITGVSYKFRQNQVTSLSPCQLMTYCIWSTQLQL